MFVDHSAVHQVMMDLSRTAHDECFSVIAYCFMPDHLHLLAAGTHPAADFRQFMRIFKQRLHIAGSSSREPRCGSGATSIAFCEVKKTR